MTNTIAPSVQSLKTRESHVCVLGKWVPLAKCQFLDIEEDSITHVDLISFRYMGGSYKSTVTLQFPDK